MTLTVMGEDRHRLLRESAEAFIKKGSSQRMMESLVLEVNDVLCIPPLSRREVYAITNEVWGEQPCP